MFAVVTSLYVVILRHNKDHSTRRNLPNPTMCDMIANHKLHELYHFLLKHRNARYLKISGL